MEKILLISWSPKKWNTYKLFSLITNSTKDLTETILLKDKNIKECVWCWFCQKGEGCAIKDDMQEIIQKMTESDTIILWSPNYFANVTWMTKKFIDRLLPMYHSQTLKHLQYKPRLYWV
jgi:multimeric flavodoxin WrbA